MRKMYNNKIMLFLNILTFFLGIAFTPIAYASRGGWVDSGVNFTPYTYPVDYYSNNNNTYNNSNYNNIPGCEGRTSGYSTQNGQPCGNVSGNTNTNTNTTTYSTVSKYTNSNTKVVKNPADNQIYNSPNASVSDVNENYGSLTANALLGSNSFMPTGLVQWILAIVLIVAIIFLWRYIHRSEEKYMAEPMKHA